MPPNPPPGTWAPPPTVDVKADVPSTPPEVAQTINDTPQSTPADKKVALSDFVWCDLGLRIVLPGFHKAAIMLIYWQATGTWIHLKLYKHTVLSQQIATH